MQTAKSDPQIWHGGPSDAGGTITCEVETIARFRDLPIRFKITLPFLFFTAILFAMSLFAFQQVRRGLLEENRDLALRLNERLSSQLGEQLLQMADLGKLPLVSEPDIRHILKASAERGHITLSERQSLMEVARDALFLSQGIHSAFVFDLIGNGTYQIQYGMIREPLPATSLPWFAQAQERRGSPVFIPTYDIGSLAEIPDPNKAVFGVARAIMELGPAQPVGVIVVNTDISYLELLAQRLEAESEFEAIIATETGAIVYDSRVKAENHPVDNPAVELPLRPQQVGETGAVSQRYEGRFFAASRVPHSGWLIITSIPASPNSRALGLTGTALATVTLILVAAMSRFFVALSRQIVRPIAGLAERMQNAESGNLRDNAIDAADSNDEIGKLQRSFSRMLQRLENLIEERYIRQVRLKELEIEQLQSRINPHFLYNSLTSIHMLAESNDDTETSVAARSLGKALKYSITRIDEFVPLRDDMGYLREFLTLYRLSFDNDVDVRLEIRPEAASVRVPKLLVQPLLENAFRHGVGHYVSGGVVRILADVSEGVLRVEVSDNGPGVSEARLEELRKMIREEKHRSEHLGLRNVHRRLVLNFGPEYGLKVGTSHWGGFEASFTAPADAGNKPTYGTRAEQGLIGQG